MTQAREPGLHLGMDFEEYTELPYWNASSLKRLPLSPRAAKHGRAQRETRAMQSGTLVHMALLEPERFAREVVVMPHFKGNMNDDTALGRGHAGGKQSKAAWLAEHAQATILDAEIRDEVLGIANAFRECEPARQLLTTGESEVTLIWDDPLGVRCKARLDQLIEREDGKGWTIVDLKKTRSVAEADFNREIDSRDYNISAALYCRGVAQVFGIEEDCVFGDGISFAWVAFESYPPHWPRLVYMPGPMRQAALTEVEEMLRTVAWCEARGEWPDHSDRVYVAEMNAYRKTYKRPDYVQEIA